MAAGLPQLLSEVERVGSPAQRSHRGKPTPFLLSCRVEAAENWDAEALEASLGLRLPDGLRQLWALSGGVRLFVDQEYGQWGLVIWSPEIAIQRTREELNARPEEYRTGDLVVGGFLGDADLLLVRCAPDAPDFGAAMVVLPIDPRDEWELVAPSVEDFIARYVHAEGDKFWE